MKKKISSMLTGVTVLSLIGVGFMAPVAFSNPSSSFEIETIIEGVAVEDLPEFGLEFLVTASWDEGEWSGVLNDENHFRLQYPGSLPVGTEVTFTEAPVQELEDFNFLGYRFEPSPLVIRAGEVSVVELINTYEWKVFENSVGFSTSISVDGNNVDPQIKIGGGVIEITHNYSELTPGKTYRVASDLLTEDLSGSLDIWDSKNFTPVSSSGVIKQSLHVNEFSAHYFNNQNVIVQSSLYLDDELIAKDDNPLSIEYNPAPIPEEDPGSEPELTPEGCPLDDPDCSENPDDGFDPEDPGVEDPEWTDPSPEKDPEDPSDPNLPPAIEENPEEGGEEGGEEGSDTPTDEDGETSESDNNSQDNETPQSGEENNESDTTDKDSLENSQDSVNINDPQTVGKDKETIATGLSQQRALFGIGALLLVAGVSFVVRLRLGKQK